MSLTVQVAKLLNFVYVSQSKGTVDLTPHGTSLDWSIPTLWKCGTDTWASWIILSLSSIFCAAAESPSARYRDP